MRVKGNGSIFIHNVTPSPCAGGEQEGVDETGRFFKYYTVESLKDLIDQIPFLKIVDIWESISQLSDRKQIWTNSLVLKKQG